MMEAAKHSFRPELLNRVEEIIVFRSLQEEDIRVILGIEVNKVAARLKAREIRLSVQAAALDFLMAKGFDRQYGARQLRRAVERWLENPLAEEILRGRIPEGEIIEVEADADKLTFHPPGAGGRGSKPAATEGAAAAPAKKPARRRKKAGPGA
jgi:ATP-dependent Clp protease ATP-binding subunit ClpC